MGHLSLPSYAKDPHLGSAGLSDPVIKRDFLLVVHHMRDVRGFFKPRPSRLLLLQPKCAARRFSRASMSPPLLSGTT